MNFRFTIVETTLNRAEFRWKWLKFLRHSFLLASMVCLIWLVGGVAMVRGWLTDKGLAVTLFGAVVVFGLIAWVVVLIRIFAGTADRHWLASALEQVDRRLLDRLNTLLFLESRRGDQKNESFALRIARQTQRVLAEQSSPAPFRSARPILQFVVFTVLLIGTVLLYQKHSPWNHLIAAQKSKPSVTSGPDKSLDLGMPATNSVEQDRLWGEVRITEPGADLKVTKLDVVPLQIEAAANQSLEKVAWFSAINGGEEALHELPAPSEPRYAAYQPDFYLDELHLSDWDVVTYYAKAATAKDNAYASEVYFLEVRPFREDILKLPGGENGKAHQCLNELSVLINRQQHVIRQTHQHLQKPPEQENLVQKDRKKLADAEHDLGDSAEHLYARLTAEMENKPIGEALDSLAKAQQSLDKASRQLQDNLMTEAQGKERTALSELVAARKIFQKVIHDHPEAFDENTEEPPPVADSWKALNQITQFRNEAKAARQFIDKALAQQRKIEQQAKSAPRNDLPRLGAEEKELSAGLHDFIQQHPKPFQGADKESQEAEESVKQAGDSLLKRNNDARTATQQATRSLENLQEAAMQNSAERQLADAYRLKQMLDQQIQTFGKCSNPGANGSGTDLPGLAGQTQETINQLKKLSEQEPTRDAFGQPLRDALSGQNKVDLDARLNRARQALDPDERRQRAGEAKEGLNRVSEAFTQSQPKATQMARQTDSLKPGDQDGFAMGMSKLQSLIKKLEQQDKLSPEDQTRQGKEALYNLQLGLRSQYGDNDRGNQILLQLEQILKAETALEPGDLKKLMDELQHFSVETSDRLAKKEEKPEVTNIDPAKLPPAYRGRIQKYFQKLSENAR